MPPAAISPVACPKCGDPLPWELHNTGDVQPCPLCQTDVQVHVFPAYANALPAPATGKVLLEPGAATCFFHEDKQAEVPCDRCGRYLCRLCDMPIGNRHLCPACLHAGQNQAALPELERGRLVLDQGALYLVLVPLLFWPITLVTAPAALILALCSFKKPTSLVRSTRSSAWVAIILALLQILGWILLFAKAGLSWFR